MKDLNNSYEFIFEGVKDNIHQFRFISSGEYEITKVILISPLGFLEGWYNVSFGNLEKIAGRIRINDSSDKNNNDYDKVLATVFNCVLYFLRNNPLASVTFFGNTVHKHFLYKRKISANLKSLEEYLHVFGGRLLNEVILKDREQTIVRKGKEVKRTIKQKNIDHINMDNIEIEYIEQFKKKNIDVYHFIFLQLR